MQPPFPRMTDKHLPHAQGIGEGEPRELISDEGSPCMGGTFQGNGHGSHSVQPIQRVDNVTTHCTTFEFGDGPKTFFLWEGRLANPRTTQANPDHDLCASFSRESLRAQPFVPMDDDDTNNSQPRGTPGSNRAAPTSRSARAVGKKQPYTTTFTTTTTVGQPQPSQGAGQACNWPRGTSVSPAG